jgi:cobalt-zinc-cadmium efflux system protein
LLREGVHILLEGVPYGMELEEVIEALRSLPGVTDVHHVHVWSLCSNVHALSAHLITCEIDDDSREALLTEADRMVGERFRIAETTFQVETTACDPGHVLHVSSHGRAHARAGGNHNH